MENPTISQFNVYLEEKGLKQEEDHRMIENQLGNA